MVKKRPLGIDEYAKREKLCKRSRTDTSVKRLDDIIKRKESHGDGGSTDFDDNSTHRNKIIDWSAVVDVMTGFYKRQESKLASKNKPVPLWKSYTKGHMEAQNSTGDSRLAALRGALAHLDQKYCRSKHQRLFHDAFIASCIRNIYRDEYSSCYLRILEENNWSECRQEVFICCPRRFGKTFAVAMYCAAYAMTQDEQRICIFSPSRRQSKMLLDQIKKFVCEYEDAKDRIIKFNQEELWLQGPGGPNDIRVICSYPSKVSALLSILHAQTHLIHLCQISLILQKFLPKPLHKSLNLPLLRAIVVSMHQLVRWLNEVVEDVRAKLRSVPVIFFNLCFRGGHRKVGELWRR